MKKIILIFVLSFCFGFVHSCASRKINKSEEQKKIDSSSVGSTEKNGQVLVRKEEKKEDKSTEKETEKSIRYNFNPKDSSKPIVIIDGNGKEIQVLNADLTVEKIEKTKDKKTDLKQDSKEKNSVSFNEKTKDSTSIKKDISNKNIQKEIKKIPFWMLIPWYIYLIIFLILFIVWYNRKRIPYIRNFFT